MIEETPLLLEHHARLYQVLVVSQQTACEGFGVLRDSLGIEIAELAREFTRIFFGSGKRQCRIRRVDVDRSHVELELRPDLLQIKAADPGDAFQARDELERQRYPGAPFALAKNELVVLNRESRGRLGRVAINGKRNDQFGVFLAKRVYGSVEVRFNVVTRNLDRVDRATIHRARREYRVVRMEGECAVPAEQVWRAHSRKC